MPIVELNDNLRIIACDWILSNLSNNRLLQNFVQQSMTNPGDEKSYVEYKKSHQEHMGLECLFALANKFSRPVWIHDSSGEILKNFEGFKGKPIRVDYDGKVYRVSDI